MYTRTENNTKEDKYFSATYESKMSPKLWQHKYFTP